MMIHRTSSDITRQSSQEHQEPLHPLAICDTGDLDRLATNTQGLSAATGGMHNNCRFICLHI